MTRGRRPGDEALFAPAEITILRAAAADLGWLLERGYAEGAALKLVGDRYQLRARQRAALVRSAASRSQIEDRRSRELELPAIAGRPLVIDALNVLITVEAALAGAVILSGLDGAWRDLASVHGTWRHVAETDRAIEILGVALAGAEPSEVRWLIDRPVSNSGRLASRLRDLAAERGWSWEVATASSPDAEIVAAAGSVIAATSDSWILDHCGPWIDLPRAAITAAGQTPWMIDAGDPTTPHVGR